MLPNPNTLFAKAVEQRASDVHAAVAAPLFFRIDGQLVAQTEAALTVKDVDGFVAQVLDAQQSKTLADTREIDIAYALGGGVRLRINCHYERGNAGLVARIIPSAIPSLGTLDLTTIASQIAGLHDGLVLFTGPTGAGKSTALASIIASIHESRATSIVTLEDPIEFLFGEGKGIVRQRQLGSDFHSFAEALKRVLRQDPNIIMVGEMRDPETIAAALTLAETGHLVLATLHTPNTVQAIDRIIDVFPPHQQPQVRSQLSLSLRMVVAQHLLPRVGGGRIALREVLVTTPAVANTIRDARLQELASVLQTGSDKGMVPLEKEAKRLYKEGLIAKDVYERCVRVG